MTLRAKIFYLGKKAVLDPKIGGVKVYVRDYAFTPKEDWEDCVVQELRKILDKYEGIREVRFYVP